MGRINTRDVVNFSDWAYRNALRYYPDRSVRLTCCPSAWRPGSIRGFNKTHGVVVRKVTLPDGSKWRWSRRHWVALYPGGGK